jgi:hypothetical protein
LVSDVAALTERLLRSAHRCGEPRHLGLYREIARINHGKEWDTSELIALSAKLAPGKLHYRRYDSAVEWTPRGAAGFYASVVNAAPTDAIARLLERPANYVQDWIRDAGRSFSYLAVDYDSRVYKIYLFDPGAPAFIDAQDLRELLPRLHRSSYIDCMEIDLDRPERHTRSLYFKLGASDLGEVLEPGYRPNPRLENRLLRGVGARETVAAALRSLAAGLERVNDPVIKLRDRPAGDADVGRLEAADYAISVNTFDPGGLRYVNDHRAEILAIADALACREAVFEWLETIREFDCFISYLCVGSGFVTLYYKSTALSRKQPAAFVRGGRRAVAARSVVSPTAERREAAG